MEIYKTPESELIDHNNLSYKPVKAVFIGLGYTIVLSTIVSTVWLVMIGPVLGFDLDSPDLASEMGNNFIYMFSDMVITAIVLFLGGRAMGKRTPGKELKFGYILATITIIIYLALFIATGAFKTFPLFFNLLSLLTAAIAIIYGSKSLAKTSQGGRQVNS